MGEDPHSGAQSERFHPAHPLETLDELDDGVEDVGTLSQNCKGNEQAFFCSCLVESWGRSPPGGRENLPGTAGARSLAGCRAGRSLCFLPWERDRSLKRLTDERKEEGAGGGIQFGRASIQKRRLVG